MGRTGLSVLSQDCASWTAASPQLHVFSHLLLGCCNAAALRRGRADIFTVLNSGWNTVQKLIAGGAQWAAAD